MLIYIDFGVISLILAITFTAVKIFSIDIVGVILTNIILIIAVTMVLGALYGLFLDWLNGMKTIWLASALTAPSVYIFPFLIGIGYLSTADLSLIKFIFAASGLIAIWIIIWIIRIISMKLAGISNPNDKNLLKVLKPFSLFILQITVMLIMYKIFIA